MIATILAVLSSSGVGSIIGLLGGLANRWFDQKSKVQDQEFELKKLAAEREYLKEEYSHRLQVATLEAEGASEVAGYNAMETSYEFAKPTSRDGLVDKFSKIIRPLLTLAFFVLTIYIFYQVDLLVDQLHLEPASEQVWKIYEYIIQWIFFQSGAAIGWWFAMRPGKMPVFK